MGSEMLRSKISALSIVLCCLLSACGGGSGSDNSTQPTTPTPPTTPANQAPEVNRTIANQTATQNQPFSLDISQNGDSFSDPDGDALSYSVEISPADSGLTLQGTTLSGTITTDQNIIVTVTASDPDGLSASTSFTITVSSPPADENSAPVVNLAIPDQSATQAQAFNFDVSQNGQTFTDPDSDQLTYSANLSPVNSGLSFSGTVISGTIDIAENISVIVTASDPSGLTASDEFTIVVSPADPEPPEPNDDRNILFIIADDVGQDSLGLYDITSDIPTTPTLDSLANNGLVFDNLWVNPTCTPTRASMITGKYAQRTEVFEPGDTLDSAEITVQEQIKADDSTSHYATAIVGKWHLGGGNNAPLEAGLDHFAGILGGGIGDYFNWTINVNGEDVATTKYATTELTDQAIDWIANQDQPWFLWLAYNAPHTPFHLPPNDLHSRNDLSGDEADIEANPREYYLAALEALDTEIGRLLASLDDNTLAKTTVIFVGDNGTPGQARARGTDFTGSKGSINEGGIRVPMVVSGAGVTREGERETALINGTDFFTSFLTIAGQDSQYIHDSESFISLLSDANASKRSYIFSQNVDGVTAKSTRYKLIEYNDGTREYFDLTADPDESDNLLTTEVSDTKALDGLDSFLSRVVNDGWIVNNQNQTSPFMLDGGNFVEVNVVSLQNNGNSIEITTNATPNYHVTVDEEALAVYQSRPDRNFADGKILALGDEVQYGQDVGMSAGCADTGGDGWWPRGGSSCPESQNEMSLSFPSEPEPYNGECETGLGPVGLWVNGVPIYNWSDATSYNNEGVWDNFAKPFRLSAMDMCHGHSGNGMYHHHSYNVCLRQQVNDQGDRHSPIYGYAGDGYPIHGPYHDKNLLTKSCWMKRDYSANSETGCGVDGERSCIFVDEEDIARGVTSVNQGPSTNQTINFADAGTGLAVSGIYYQDYYFDASCPAQGEEYLDEHSGHDHDGLGYHYHTSVDENLEPEFPMVHGPDYYGDVNNGSFQCFRENF